MPSAMVTRFAICVLRNSAGEFLLLKRAPDRTFGPGLWGFIGGHIESGESPHACALRELAEEIGDHHEIDFIRAAGPVRDRRNGGRFEVHLFLFNWHEGRIELDTEHTEYVWIGIDSMHGYELMPGLEDDLMHLDLFPA